MEKNVNSHFASIVMMLASACWQQLGKIPNPMSGKTEKELQHAQVTIDLLVMLRDKTKGNLTKDEESLIANTISDLQLNYADEAAKGGDAKVN
ncbi:MAG: DUF1844 domain-containing protein [Endomicrobiales bacterium]|nr:DUF1844 domain-containing protein [Endomicrobiales bacterium]